MLPTATHETTRLYQGKQMIGEMVERGWVFVEWLYPGEKKFTAFKELREIEGRIRAEGLTGWYAKSERDHIVMHKFLTRFQARPYSQDDSSIYFKKEVM